MDIIKIQVISNVQIDSETVEKPKTVVLLDCKWLILL